MRIARVAVSLCSLALVLAACKKDDEEDKPKAETKKEAKETPKEEDDAGSLMVAEGEGEIEGPVPPDTSMVFFTVEGALYPLGCYDKDKGTMAGGTDCLAMVKAGDDVRLASHDTQYTRKAGEREEPQCLIGSGKKYGVGVADISAGADFRYASWPPSGIKAVNEVDPRSLEPAALQLSDDEIAKLRKAMGGKDGEVKAHQVADVDVDGNGKKDKVYSAYIPHPRINEEYTWSGAFLAIDGNLDNLLLLDKSKSKRDVFEVQGWLNLDGKDTSELWMRLVFEESAGDQLVNVAGGKAVPLAKHSCAVAR